MTTLPKYPLQFGKEENLIRVIAAYAAKRAGEIGAENVFNFSIGNPNVPAPKALTEKLKELLGGDYDVSFVTVSEPLCEALEGRLTERLIPIQIRILYPWMEDAEAPNE